MNNARFAASSSLSRTRSARRVMFARFLSNSQRVPLMTRRAPRVGRSLGPLACAMRLVSSTRSGYSAARGPVSPASKTASWVQAARPRDVARRAQLQSLPIHRQPLPTPWHPSRSSDGPRMPSRCEHVTHSPRKTRKNLFSVTACYLRVIPVRSAGSEVFIPACQPGPECP